MAQYGDEKEEKNILIDLVEHKISGVPISCPLMTTKNSDDPLLCPVYKAMKIDYKLTEENLIHLQKSVHHKAGRHGIPACKYGQQCQAFKRLAAGGYRVDDRCHMHIYSHPPRGDNAKLAKNINTYTFLQNDEEKSPLNDLYQPTNDDKQKYWKNKRDGWLDALIAEVTANGRKTDLMTPDGDSLVDLIVNDKMNHKRHTRLGSPLNRGEMLAFVLYTGCDCNYEMCKSQRNGDYKTWKWFDLCLYTAIDKIWRREKGTYKLYSGLANVKLDTKIVHNGFFKTYTSTSWNKNIALAFIYQYGDEGMLLEMDDDFRNSTFNRCCDVSWISKFPDECEVLMSRGGQYLDKWKVQYIDVTTRTRLKSSNVVKKTKHYDSYRNYEIAKKIQPLYYPTVDDRKKYWKNSTDGWMQPLIDEGLRNGVSKEQMNRLKQKVDAFFERSPVKLRKDQILSVLFYTNLTKLCSNFQKSQRAGDYMKFKWMDLILYSTVWKISKEYKRDWNVYHMLGGVKFANEADKELFEKGYYPSFLSTTQQLEVLIQFSKGGLIASFKSKYQTKKSIVGANVAFLSDFSEEDEVIIARSCNVTHGAWFAEVIDEQTLQKGPIQIVKIKDYGHLMQ